MKKKIVIPSIVVLVVVAVIVVVMKILGNKSNTSDKAYDISSEGVSFVYDGTYNTNIKHVFKSVEWVAGDEVENNSKYSLEYYRTMKYPEAKILTESDVDYEAFCRDYPEYDAFHRCLQNNEDPNFEKYPNEERIRISNYWKDHVHEYIIDEYYSDTCVCFFECKFENDSDKECTLELYQLQYIVYDEVNGIYDPLGQIVYFDKSQYVDGIERNSLYYEYKMKPGEVLECTIGVRFAHHSKNNTKAPTLDQIYIGYYDQNVYSNMENDGGSGVELIYGKYMVPLSEMKCVK